MWNFNILKWLREFRQEKEMEQARKLVRQRLEELRLGEPPRQEKAS